MNAMKKNILYLIAASLCLVFLAGCDDFLDTQNLTKKDTSNFPVNETDEHIMERYQAMYVDRVKQYAMFWDAYTKDELKTAVFLELTEISGSQLVQIGYVDASIVSSESTESHKNPYIFTSPHKSFLPFR